MRPNQACIVGIGQTRYTRWGGLSDTTELGLACEAILAAAADAGLDPTRIDGLTSFGDDRNEPALVASAIGMARLRLSAMLWGGGGGGSCGSVALAAMAVETGQAEYAVAFRSLAQGQTGRFGQYDPHWRHASFIHPFGAFAAPQLLALAVRRHMIDFGTTQEQLGHFALACRAHAQRNPAAVMRGRPLDMAGYLASRPISDPLKLLDCCLESDGACAVLVTTWERARDLRQAPAAILASAHGGRGDWSSGPLGAHNQPAAVYGGTGAQALAEELYARAGVTPADLDVAEIYDNFTGMALMTMEDFGLCGRGESGPFVESGAIAWPNGRLPVNTHGGCLSEAYIHGLNHVLEGVRQLRGHSTCQVADAEVCLVTGGPGPSPTSALILGKS